MSEYDTPTHSFDLKLDKNGKGRGECIRHGHAPFWFEVSEEATHWETRCWHCQAVVYPPWHLYELIK